MPCATKEFAMIFTSKSAFEVKLQPGETVEHVLIALAMASYEATEAFYEDGLTPDGTRATAMLNPDVAATYVKNDELVMVFVQGKFCMTHIRRVRRHLSQLEKGDVVTFEVVACETDVEKLFARADTILGWGVVASAVEPEVAVTEGPLPVFDIDAEIEIDIENIVPEADLMSVPVAKKPSVRPVAA
jgi:hypothetical protein